MTTRPVAPWIDALPHMHVPQKMVLDWITRNVVLDRKPVLDIGVGNSYLSAAIAGVGGMVSQVDHDQRCFSNQREHFRGLKYKLPEQYTVDIAYDRLPDSHWPVILCNFTHQHLPTEKDSDHLLCEISRALAPDGTFVLTDRISDRGASYWEGGRGDPMWVRTAADLRRKLEVAGLVVRQSASFTYDFNTDAKKEPAEWKADDLGIVLILSGSRLDPPHGGPLA